MGMMSTEITAVVGRRIWDSRGRPTVEVEVTRTDEATESWDALLRVFATGRGGRQALAQEHA